MVVVVRSSFVPVLRMVTLAPGTNAPLKSLTNPRMLVAVSTWASSAAGSKTARKTVEANRIESSVLKAHFVPASIAFRMAARPSGVENSGCGVWGTN